MQGKWRERCRNDGGSIERKEEGGGEQQWEAWRRNSMSCIVLFSSRGQ